MIERLRQFFGRYVWMQAWLILGVGMVALLLWFSRGVDLLLRERLAMVLATLAVAALCARIVVDKPAEAP